MGNYDLDVVISVGYHVKSIRGYYFANGQNEVLRGYMLNGYLVSANFN